MVDLKRNGSHIPQGRYHVIGYVNSEAEAVEMAEQIRNAGRIRSTVITPIHLKTKTKWKIGVYKI